MILQSEIIETIRMIQEEHLDIRTITLGISLRDCGDSSGKRSREKIYEKITRIGRDLVRTGRDIEKEYGIPIVNTRIAVTPISLVAEACDEEDYLRFAETLDTAAGELGVDYRVSS